MTTWNWFVKCSRESSRLFTQFLDETTHQIAYTFCFLFHSETQRVYTYLLQSYIQLYTINIILGLNSAVVVINQSSHTFSQMNSLKIIIFFLISSSSSSFSHSFILLFSLILLFVETATTNMILSVFSIQRGTQICGQSFH